MRWDWTPLYTDIFCNIIINFVQKNQLNPDQIYLIIMDYLQVPYMVEYFSKNNLKIHVAGHNQLLRNETIEYNGPVVEPIKLFSVFSRSSREWRFHFFCDLIATGLLDKCIYSYINSNPNFPYIPGEYPTELEEIKKIIPLKYRMIPNTITKISDWVDGMPYAIEKEITNYFAPSLFDAINQSAIHIVIETMHTGKLVYITEKTWKPISVRKPFIIYGVYGSVAWLNQQGYKTFSPWINEDYDLIQDDNLRKKAILHEMKRISKMNPDQLAELLEKCNSIIEHNHKKFIKDRTHIWSPEFETLGIFK
jgi:hypothetical protein